MDTDQVYKKLLFIKSVPGVWPTVLYFYGPIGFYLSANCLFFALTIWNQFNESTFRPKKNSENFSSSNFGLASMQKQQIKIYPTLLDDNLGFL
jgi:hypothetical protein